MKTIDWMFSIWTASACWPSTNFLLSLVSAYRDIQYISIKVPDDQLGVRECDDHSGGGADDDHIDDVVVNEVPQPVAAQTFYINFSSSWCVRFIQLYSVEWQLFCAKQIFTKILEAWWLSLTKGEVNEIFGFWSIDGNQRSWFMNCAQKVCALTIDIVPKTKEKTSIAQQMIEWENLKKPEAKWSSFDFECVVRLE